MTGDLIDVHRPRKRLADNDLFLNPIVPTRMARDKAKDIARQLHRGADGTTYDRAHRPANPAAFSEAPLGR
jgi:hypothetical protein